MHAAERSESQVIYEVDWMSCDIALDILQVELGGDTAPPPRRSSRQRR